MTISDGTKIKNLTLYPPTRLILEAETPLWMEPEEEEGVQPLLTIGKALAFKDELLAYVTASTKDEPQF